MKLCFSSCEAEGRFVGSRVIHELTKLRASVENLLGNFGIGFDSEPMQNIAAGGTMSALQMITLSTQWAIKKWHITFVYIFANY